MREKEIIGIRMITAVCIVLACLFSLAACSSLPDPNPVLPQLEEEQAGDQEEDPVSHTVLEEYLSRIANDRYMAYTISAKEFGTVAPDGMDSSNYVAPLLKDVVYEEAVVTRIPKGQVLTLEFPEDDVHFDFFFADGQQNLIRQVRAGEEVFYQANFKDPSRKAAELMNDWYQALGEIAP